MRIVADITSSLSSVGSSLGRVFNSQITFVVGGGAAAAAGRAAFNKYCPTFDPKAINIRETALNIRQWATGTVFPVIKKTWEEKVVPTLETFYQEKALPLYQQKVVPFVSNNLNKLCDTFYRNGEVTRVGVGVGVAGIILVAATIGEVVKRRFFPDTRPTQADYNAVVAERDARPTQVAYDAVVADLQTTNKNNKAQIKFLFTLLRSIEEAPRVRALSTYLDNLPANDRPSFKECFVSNGLMQA